MLISEDYKLTADITKLDLTAVIRHHILKANFTLGAKVTVPFLTKENIGLAGDGVTDDAFKLNQKLRELWEAGLSACIWLNPQDDKFFRFNSSVDIRSNQWLIFSGTKSNANVRFGANGRIRLFGKQTEEPTSNLPKIRQTVSAGTTTIYMGSQTESLVSNFQVGQRIVIRGKSDGSGIALEKEEKTIVSIDTNNNNLEVDTAFEETYLTQYPSSDFETNFGIPDRTFVTRLITQDFTSNVLSGNVNIPLVSVGSLAIGDYIYIIDDQVAGDIGGTSNNYTRQETARINNIVGNTITLNHSLYHSYETAQNARVVKLNAVENARLTGARMSWLEPPSSRNIHGVFLGYAVNSLVEDCHIDDTAGYGNKGNGFRHDIGYNNTITNCSVERPSSIVAGEGYGFSFYGSTNSNVSNCYTDGCRHAYLWFKGASGCCVKNVTSINTTISDIDFHGANELYNVADGVTIVGGITKSNDANDKPCIKLGNEFHLAGCSYNVVRNVSIQQPDNVNSVIGIDILPASKGNRVENVTMRNVNIGVQIIDQSNDATLKAQQTVLKNISIDNPIDRAFKLRGNANGSSTKVIKDLTILDCEIYNASRHIDLVQAENVTISGLHVISPASTTTYNYVVDANDVAGLRVVKNYIADTQRAVKIQDCPSAVIQGNNFVGLLSSSTPINNVSGNTNAILGANTDNSTLNLSTLPTNNTGLDVGDLWNDNGDVKIKI
jgi:hypothetical protein